MQVALAVEAWILVTDGPLVCLVCSFVIISSWYGAGFRFGGAIFVVESWRYAEASVIVSHVSCDLVS